MARAVSPQMPCGCVTRDPHALLPGSGCRNKVARRVPMGCGDRQRCSSAYPPSGTAADKPGRWAAPIPLMTDLGLSLRAIVAPVGWKSSSELRGDVLSPRVAWILRFGQSSCEGNE